jgi:hypothetical protein
MQKFKVLSFLSIILFSSISHGTENTPFVTVQEFFAATSASDHNRLRAIATEDFQLLEVGEVWDIDKLISVIQPTDMKRLNYFNLISTKVMENVAWVSYWNKAKFVRGDNEGQAYWLESAVLIKSNSKWRIQMLHSTKINEEQFPRDILMTEFTE